MEKNATETYGMLQTVFRPSSMNRSSVFEWHKRFKEGRESVRDDDRCGRSKEVNTPQLILREFRKRDSEGRGQHSSNRVSSISTRTTHQSTTPSLSQTIWPKWASKQFHTLPIVQTLLPVTFGYSLSSEAVVMRQLRRWKRLWRRLLTRSHKRTSMWAFQKLWERYNKCIPSGGDYFEGDSSFMCVLSIKVSIRKQSGNLSYALKMKKHKVFKGWFCL